MTNKSRNVHAKKYELTDDVLEYEDHTLHRIKALVDIIGVVEAGELGGWIESEKNLSHKGKCWVYGDAKVFGCAKVYGDASVYGIADICGNAAVYGNADIYGNATVCGHAIIYGNACVYGDATVHEYACVYGYAEVYDHADVYGNAVLSMNAKVYDDAEVCEDAKVQGNTAVHGNSMVCGAALLADGEITGYQDYICVGPIGSRNAFTTLNKITGTVCTGCFYGTIDEFEAAVEKTHGGDKHGVAYKELISYFKMLVN